MSNVVFFAPAVSLAVFHWDENDCEDNGKELGSCFNLGGTPSFFDNQGFLINMDDSNVIVLFVDQKRRMAAGKLEVM